MRASVRLEYEFLYSKHSSECLCFQLKAVKVQMEVVHEDQLGQGTMWRMQGGSSIA